MGGHDNYYMLSGASHLNRGDDIQKAILWHLNEAFMEQTAEREQFPDDFESAEFQMQPITLSNDLLKGLCYSDDDVEGSRLLVLLSLCEEDEEGNIEIVDRIEEHETQTESTPENVMPIFNVVPGDMADYGEYWDKDDKDVRYTMQPLSSTAGVMHTSYMIAQAAAPQLEPYILHHVLRMNRLVLDYGELGAIQDQYVDWSAIYSPEREPGDRVEFWYNLLVAGRRTDGERLHEAWKGPGNLWTMVRPDRFPIRETLGEITGDSENANRPHRIAALPRELILPVFKFLHPRDIRALLSTSKSMRSALRKLADRHTFNRMLREEPWYLPAGPFDFQGGSQEGDWWKEQWAKKGNANKGVNSSIIEETADQWDDSDDVDNIPWLNYRHACSHRMSMWNRIRIWRVVKQVEVVAIQRNLISTST